MEEVSESYVVYRTAHDKYYKIIKQGVFDLRLEYYILLRAVYLTYFVLSFTRQLFTKLHITYICFFKVFATVSVMLAHPILSMLDEVNFKQGKLTD